MKVIKELNNEIMQKNKQQLRDLEQFYTENKVDNMLNMVEKKKEKITSDLIKFAEEHKEPVKWDDDGNPVEYNIKTNPLVISNYFFKSITPISSQEPIYNAEKLGIVFDYYCYILAEVNDKIGDFPSSLTSFCKLAGITLSTLRNYKNSADYNMRVIVDKIYDQIGDENLTMSQMKLLNEKTTIFKLKSQNELVETVQPNVNVNLTGKDLDFESINNRMKKYKQFATKKGNK